MAPPRSLTIFIVINLAVTGLRVNAFSIARPAVSDMASDMAQADSRIDMKRVMTPSLQYKADDSAPEKIIPIVTKPTNVEKPVITIKHEQKKATRSTPYNIEPTTASSEKKSSEAYVSTVVTKAPDEDNAITNNKVIGIKTRAEITTTQSTSTATPQDVSNNTTTSSVTLHINTTDVTNFDKLDNYLKEESELQNETTTTTMTTLEDEVTTTSTDKTSLKADTMSIGTKPQSTTTVTTTTIKMSSPTTAKSTSSSSTTTTNITPVKTTKFRESTKHSTLETTTESESTVSTTFKVTPRKKYTVIDRKRPNITSNIEKTTHQIHSTSTETSSSTTQKDEQLITANTMQQTSRKINYSTSSGKSSNRSETPESIFRKTLLNEIALFKSPMTKSVDFNDTNVTKSSTAAMSTDTSTGTASTSSTLNANANTTIKENDTIITSETTAKLTSTDLFTTVRTTKEDLTITEIDTLKKNTRNDITAAIVTEVTQKSSKYLNTPTVNNSGINKLIDTTVPASSEVTKQPTNVPKTGVYSSQRGGFLDLSRKPSKSTPIMKIVTPVNDQNVLKWSKSSSGMTSQSQLNEDAINEELMKEEVLNDNYNHQNHRESRLDAKTNTQSSLKEEKKNLGETSNSMISTEAMTIFKIDDKLSVKPISSDKIKNTGLYAVNPNYKPLKKLDVQPSKSYARNPDDNSWRNQSLSSLGIVFKGKNSSKPFTEVLKNKTETELNALVDKLNKDGEPELRERLEKIAEMRKSKKKKNDGDLTYSDYEEADVSSTERTTTSYPSYSPMLVPTSDPLSKFSSDPVDEDPPKIIQPFEFSTIGTKETKATRPPKKMFNTESYDDDEVDYVTLANIDLKKYIHNANNKALVETAGTSRNTVSPTPAITPSHYLPDRKPTVQYFPPRVAPKVSVNDYDDDFKKKINEYTLNTANPTKRPAISYSPTGSDPEVKYNTVQPAEFTHTSGATKQSFRDHNTKYSVVNPDGSFDRASYVIKHLRDFISGADKESEEDSQPYVLTEAPRRPGKPKAQDYEEYDGAFRKDVLDRFIENFNQNSDRFKVDFPIVYNTSVSHGGGASSVFLRRLYEESRGTGGPAEPCERTVELSPEYELHYYVPDQEEREQVPAPHHHAPYRNYRMQL